MRNSCGSNDHPDSALFIQMYRLISTYNLIKPAKGSNVRGEEIVQSLISLKDLKNIDDRRQQFDAHIDKILDKGTNCSALEDAAIILNDHEYFKCTTSDYVLSYMAGFVARKSRRFIKYHTDGNKKKLECLQCFNTLRVQDQEHPVEEHKLIHLRDKGHLIRPSKKLFELISVLEKVTLETIKNNNIHSETLFEIMERLENYPHPLPKLGCFNHSSLVTHSIVRFYLITRMFFITKQVNKNENIEKERAREANKRRKLLTVTTEDEKRRAELPQKNKPSVAKKRKIETLEKQNTVSVTKENNVRPLEKVIKVSVTNKRKNQENNPSKPLKKKRVS